MPTTSDDNSDFLAEAGLLESPDRSHSEARWTIAWTIFLLFYFSTCDVFLKFLPVAMATVLRYLPEAILYLLVVRSMRRRFALKSFPLLWPLLACASVMLISGLLNREPVGALIDFRVFFRFAAFAYLFWNLDLTSSDILRFVDGFFALTIVQLIVGGLELIGSNPVKLFFTPLLGWGGNTAPLPADREVEHAIWIAGTLANYNDYGLFMVLSTVLAVSLYLALGGRKYLWLSGLSALAAVLSSSRHCLILMGVSVPFLVYFHRTRLTRILRPLAFAMVLTSIMGAFVSSSSSVLIPLRRASSIFNPDTFTLDNPQQNIRFFMMVFLPGRFLSVYPFFGQGPIPASESIAAGDTDTDSGPTLKAAPELPGWVTYYMSDVVWLFVLCLYGIFGVLAVAGVFVTIGYLAKRTWRRIREPIGVAICQTCGLSAVLIMIAAFFSLEVVARDVIPVFWCVAGIVFSLHRKSAEIAAPAETAT